MVMPGYMLDANPKKTAKAYGRALRISTKSSVVLCRAVTGRNLPKGKRLLQDLLDKKRSLEGKYYTNAARSLLDLIKSAEMNAEFKGLDTSRMIINASAHQGFTFIRPRRMKMRRTRRKMTNLQVVLQQK